VSVIRTAHFFYYDPNSFDFYLPQAFLSLVSGAQSAGILDIHFTVGSSCKRAASLAEKNAAQHHVLRSLISLHNEHRVYLNKIRKEVEEWPADPTRFM
jgi:hypothetical protein